jgi:hypothetical protein
MPAYKGLSQQSKKPVVFRGSLSQKGPFLRHNLGSLTNPPGAAIWLSHSLSWPVAISDLVTALPR